MRAAEINVDIIKNQLENVNTETALMKAQHEQTQKKLSGLKLAYAQLRSEQDHRRVRKSSNRRGPSNNEG